MSSLLRIVAWMLALALVALPVVAAVNGWIGAERWPLTRLRVHGEFERVDPAMLRTVVLPFAARGFFAVRLDEAQQAIERLPWVERAEVRKRWPDIIEILVVEHRPFARWGNDRLLSVQGRLFPIPKGLALDRLPRLSGPDTQVPEVVALYNESRSLFAPLGLEVSGLAMDRRGSWSMVLDNGTQVVVGRADTRPRLGRFARMLPQLLASNTRPLRRADLRYTNGFSLSWQEEQGTGTREAGDSQSGGVVVAETIVTPLATRGPDAPGLYGVSPALVSRSRFPFPRTTSVPDSPISRYSPQANT